MAYFFVSVVVLVVGGMVALKIHEARKWRPPKKDAASKKNSHPQSKKKTGGRAAKKRKARR